MERVTPAAPKSGMAALSMAVAMAGLAMASMPTHSYKPAARGPHEGAGHGGNTKRFKKKERNRAGKSR